MLIYGQGRDKTKIYGQGSIIKGKVVKHTYNPIGIPKESLCKLLYQLSICDESLPHKARCENCFPLLLMDSSLSNEQKWMSKEMQQ